MEIDEIETNQNSSTEESVDSQSVKRVDEDVDNSIYGVIKRKTPALFHPISEDKRKTLEEEKAEMRKKFSLSKLLMNDEIEEDEDSDDDLLSHKSSKNSSLITKSQSQLQSRHSSSRISGQSSLQQSLSYDYYPRDMTLRTSIRIYSQYAYPEILLHNINSLTFNNIYIPPALFSKTNESINTKDWVQNSSISYTYYVFPYQRYSDEMISILQRNKQLHNRYNDYIASYLSLTSIYMSQFDYKLSEHYDNPMKEEPAQRSVYTNNEFYLLSPTFTALFTSDKHNIPICIFYSTQYEIKEQLSSLPIHLYYPYKESNHQIDEMLLFQSSRNSGSRNRPSTVSRPESVFFIYSYIEVYKFISWLLNYSCQEDLGIDVPTLLAPFPFTNASNQKYSFLYRGEVQKGSIHYNTIRITNDVILPSFVEHLTYVLIYYLKSHAEKYFETAQEDVLLFELEFTNNNNTTFFNIPNIDISDIFTSSIQSLACYMRPDHTVYYIPMVKQTLVK